MLGHHIYINASIGVLAAENMPGWDEQSIRRDVYGNIPGGQNVAAGAYTDTVVATIEL